MSGKARKATIERKKWDRLAAIGLTDTKQVASYLEEAFEDGPQMFLLALSRIIKARGGVGALAKKSGLSRSSLSKFLREAHRAQLSSVSILLSALDIVVHFRVKSSKRKSLSNTLVSAAKDLKFSNTTINKLKTLNNRKAISVPTKTINKNTSKRRG